MGSGAGLDLAVPTIVSATASSPAPVSYCPLPVSGGSAFQDPAHDVLQVTVADLFGGVRRHRDRAPDTGAAFADFFGQLGNGIALALVLGGDVLEGWADQLLE